MSRPELRAILPLVVILVFFGMWVIGRSEKEAQPRVVRHSGNRSEATIIVVSDIHNNRAAIRLASDLAGRYKADFVLDAGDITDFGSESEKEILTEAAKLPVPHVFVAGNHDSRQVTSILAGFDNTVMPDERVMEVAGVRILGQNDPVSRAKSPHPVDTSAAQRENSYRRLRTVLKSLSSPPDVLIVHEPAIGRRFLGSAALIVLGHTHKPSVSVENGSVVVNPGSTGAAGLRSVTEGRIDQMTADVIRVRLRPTFKVLTVDMASVSTRTGKSSVRRVFER